MHQLLVWYQSIPSETWILILGASGVSALTQFGKKLLELENEKIVQMLFIGVAFAASALQYLLGSHNLPPSILGIHTAALMGVATPLYFYAVKPANNFINDLKTFKQSQAAKTEADASVAAVVPPAQLFNEDNPTDGLVETGSSGLSGDGTQTTISPDPSPAEFTA